MYARVLHVEIQPGQLDEAVRRYRESLIPAAQELPGFRGALLLTEPGTGNAISVSLWETEAELQAGETSGYVRAQLANLGPLFAVPPRFDVYQVSLQVPAPRAPE
jgi:heme-degrading monooxygenase HmoA